MGLDSNVKILISHAIPGVTWENGMSSINIDVGIAVDSSIINNMATLLGKYHIHPRGNSINVFIQPPSQSDLTNAVFPINIVAGAQSRMIYFYNTTGVINQMSFSRFMQGCN